MKSWTKDLRGTDAPKQYRQGYVEFYKLKLKVDERFLIPRPETELLVDEVLAFVGSDPLKGRTLSATILDIGTGSGCIAISLAKNLPKVKIFATDISKEALELAKENAKLQHVSDRIVFVESDLLSVIANPEGVKQSTLENNPIKIATSPSAPRNDVGIDIIVTNLPYIPGSRIPYLARSVKDFEPWLALDGGPDGFDLYRKLFTQIKEKNFSPKIIITEIDESQDGFDHIALTEAKKYFPKAGVEIKLDLAKKPRILIIKLG